MIKITLSDGTELDDLTKDDDYYVSETEINPDVFIGNLVPVQIDYTVNDVMHHEHHFRMILDDFIQNENECRFKIRDLTDREFQDISIRAYADYFSLVSGIDIDQ